ncbi:CoA-binding protein [Muriicola sp. Z0-33]|uniref:CoA-binding protein n=1 Tax=Muriicola sp. Z0-33 TaxID=2816957 RepID=UPI00223814A8|nr:CoA-binding protein [Muriicola sp. Z0-33]MCW5517375.1 CoA-binding protein [Muriicola sp. Z0-33]
MKKTLVFGASLKPGRYSNLTIRKLMANGIETVAFGHNSGEVSGIQITTNLQDFHNIHTITLYLNPVVQPNFYQKIVDLRPKRVIFNPGTENSEFYEILKKSNIEVEVACSLVLLATRQY